MRSTKKLKIISIITGIILIFTMFGFNKSNADEEKEIKVNLTELKYNIDGQETLIKKYSQNAFNVFISDYQNNKLPSIYITEFLYDGVSMVKPYDLEDFAENGKDAEIEPLKLTVININTTGNIEFSGELKGGMIAVNTNGVTGNINLNLNNVKLDTDSKKAPAIYVYNKDITSTSCKVTIKTTEESKNYIEGGKFKKVSLVGSDELDNYTGKYSGENKTNYTEFTKYYGVYTSEQVKNILFAKVQADNEDLQEGDPFYFYKGAGAISSDIDLYFEGKGYLEVTSKNKEGIESKGNLTFQGGTGDYKIYAEDDCLNTTTKSSSSQSARNDLTIDVNSLTAIVDSGEDADEGDAIDSNGTLTINKGTILAIAHPGQDAGLDSEKGIYINGGTVLATGDMYDQISAESKQNFIALNFQKQQSANTLIAIVNSSNEVLAAYKTDRSYTNLIFSSPNLSKGSYSVLRNGNITGKSSDGFYTDVTGYINGIKLGYSKNGINGGTPMGNQGQKQGDKTENQQPPENGKQPPQKPNDLNESEQPKKNEEKVETATQINESPETGEFKISGVSNLFSGLGDYTGNEDNSKAIEEANENDKLDKAIKIQNIIIICVIIIGLILVSIIFAISKKKKKD